LGPIPARDQPGQGAGGLCAALQVSTRAGAPRGRARIALGPKASRRDTVDVGMIGLGKMGGNMATRLIQGGHRVVGTDPALDVRQGLEQHGGESAPDVAALVSKLAT